MKKKSGKQIENRRNMNVTQSDCMTFVKIVLSPAAQRKAHFFSGRFLISAF